MRKFLETKGYDIQKIKKEGFYKVILWRGEECLGEGKYNYKTWQEAESKTIQDIYIKINSDML